MQMDLETLKLQVRDYISPECTCKVEDIVNALPHVVESSFNPVNNLLTVKVHKGMTSADEIVKELRKCSVRCEQLMPANTMGQMEHETEIEKKLIKHEMAGMRHEKTKFAAPDHHAMMAAEFKRHFLVAASFTIPILILSPSIQSWAGYNLPPSPVWNALLLILASIR